MASDRYNNIFVCAPPGSVNYPIAEEASADLIRAFTIRSEADIDQLGQMMTKIFCMHDQKSCLWIDDQLLQIHKQKIYNLLFLLYSRQYLFRYSRPVIYLVKDQPGRNAEELSDWIADLGFVPLVKEIESWNVSGAYDKAWFVQADTNRLSDSELFFVYSDLLKKKLFVGNDIFIFSSKEENIRKTVTIISEAEDTISQTDLHLHGFFSSYRLLSKEEERLSNENKRLEIDLDNQKKYLAILRNEREMERIIEFYHREYEVLPLWYKRFGHLIKLLIGKRSIRSTHNQR